MSHREGDLRMAHSDSELKHSCNKQRVKRVDYKAKRRITPVISKRAFLAKVLNHRICNELKLIQAVSFNNTEEVERLLDSGVSADGIDLEKRSALHVAVSKGYSKIVKMLLDHGADPNKRDVIQNTPLHLAACVHNLEIITILISAGAKVSSLDLHGRNPLQLASSKLQILQRTWRDGSIEMFHLRSELRQVVSLLLSLMVREQVVKIEETNSTKSDVEDLNMIKLSLDSSNGNAEELDDQMTKLLNDIEKFKLT